jgi:hypothetical protein
MKRKLSALAAALVLVGALFAAHKSRADELHCGAPAVFLGDEPDGNPVVNVDVIYDPDLHAWQIFHRHLNGMVAARAQQYAIEDWTADSRTRWAGTLNRNRALYMVGEVNENGYYDERLYDRKLGNRLVVHLGVQCRIARPVAVAPAQVPVRTVPVAPVAPVVPVTPAAPAPAAPAPVQQQAAPVVVSPVIIVPPYQQQQQPASAPASAPAPTQAPSAQVPQAPTAQAPVVTTPVPTIGRT